MGDGPPGAALARLELRIERLRLMFRFTYAFHAREVRFERDAGSGYQRVFPETFSFHVDRHDPAELYVQLDDLLHKPELLSPRARRRDAEVLMDRLVAAIPRYVEALLDRFDADERLDEEVLARIYEDASVLVHVLLRFIGDRGGEVRPPARKAAYHLRKLAWRTLSTLLALRVEPGYLEAFVAGTVDPVDPADDLSEAGFSHTMDKGDPAAVNRSLVRLAERAFYRWLEEVCLAEDTGAFDVEDSPFESRENEVRRGISANRELRVLRGRDLSPFLRRPRNRDCLRVLKKLESWFLRRYDVHHAAVVIHHGDAVAHGVDDADRVLSRHETRNYVFAISALAAPFAAASVAYERAPFFFDVLCTLELLGVGVSVLWFLFYRFAWKRDLTFFHASVPRIAAGIIVGYLPIFFIDEVWSLAQRSWITLGSVSLLLGFTTLLYLYVEVQRRLQDPDEAFARARQIFLLGSLQAFGMGLLFTGLVGGFMASRNWANGELPVPLEALRGDLPPFLGQLPAVVGIDPFYTFPAAVFVMTFLSFFIGTFLQLMWEDLPITEPL